MGVTHTFVSTRSDGTNTGLLRPSDWNAEHTIAGLTFGAHQDTEYVTGDASDNGSLTPYSQIINTLHDLVLAVGGAADIHVGRLVSGTGQLFLDMDIRVAEFVAPYAGSRAARDHGLRIYQNDNSVIIEFPITGGIIELAGVIRGNNGANKDIILRNGDAAGVLRFNNAANNATRLQVNDSGDTLIGGALDHNGASVGFYGTDPIAKQTGVAVSAAGIHAALVNLGLIAA